MNKIILSAVLLLGFIAFNACSNYGLYTKYNVSGTTWDITTQWNSGNGGTFQVSFKDDKTTSFSSGQTGTWSESGNDVTFTLVASSSNTATYKARVGSTTMSGGSMSNSFGDKGTFSAIKK